MGSRAGDGYPDEHPQHSVRVPPFYLGRHPVTQEQWQATMGRLRRCRGLGARRPVDRVSWRDARDFCEQLSRKTGRAYRMPSEAEWEYACRAGTTTPFHCGRTITTDLANYVGEHTYLREPKGLYRHGSTDVGSFPANAFGLCDMHANVWEWCADAWHDDYSGAPTDGGAWARGPAGRVSLAPGVSAGRPPEASTVAADSVGGGPTAERVLRGGCWHDPPDLCRSAARLKQAPDQGEDFFGFRVALTSLERPPVRPEKSIIGTVRRWFFDRR